MFYFERCEFDSGEVVRFGELVILVVLLSVGNLIGVLSF